MGWASCIEDIIERACEIEHMRRDSNPGRALFQSGADSHVVSINELTADMNSNRQRPASSMPEPALTQPAPAKRNRLKEKSQYFKLIDREKGLLGDVRIESDVVYLPIGVVENLHREVDSLSTDILRFVLAGYNQKSTLLRRLKHRAGVQHDIDWLVANGWLEQISEGEGEITLRVRQMGPVCLSIETSLTYFDAITGIQVELPEGTALLNRDQLDESAPVMAERDWCESEENVKFLECLVMLIFSGRQNARLRDRLHHVESDLANREQAVHMLERQVQLEQQEQTHNRSESIRMFWGKREDFYRGLHRGVLAEQGANRKRLKNFRYQSLCADMELIAQLGGTLDLFEESLRFARCTYDGSLYRWYDEGEEPLPNGALATVYLPGWQLGDVRVKPSLGRKEVDIE